MTELENDQSGNSSSQPSSLSSTEPSDTKEVTSYFNIFECGRNILYKLDVKYQRVFMATPKDKYYNRFLDTLTNDNNHKGKPFPNEKLQQAFRILMEETEAEFERNMN